jgi:hypothetical protein
MAMTRTEQGNFVTELIEHVKADILTILPHIPEEWDGHELRQLIADRFTKASKFTLQDRKRYRAYRNFIITHSLRGL